MELASRIGSLIERKGAQVWSVGPDATVYDAIAEMADKQVGALPVLEGGRVLGIVSERDYARKVTLQGRLSRETPVTAIMSSPVVTVTPKHTVGECMQIVTEKRIRHLPVVDGGRVVGMISIGDLVNWVIQEQRETIQHLEAYISGNMG